MSMQQPTRSRFGLGLWMLTALVTGNMIGSGIFLLPASLASYGSISLFSWVFTAAGALLLAAVFAKMSQWMPRTGGPYAYCHEAYGDFVGFQMAYNYWIAVWVGNAAIAVGFVGYLGVFWPALNSNSLANFLISAGSVWLMTIINIIGVRPAGIMQLVTTVLKILPLLLVGIGGLFFIKGHNLADFNVSGKGNFSALTGAATLTLWAFIGLESATIPAENVRNPERTIPRATLLGTLLTGGIYILSSLAIMGMIPAENLIHSTAPYADAAAIICGPFGRWLVAIGAVVSCLGALNGWTLLQAQVPYAAARDGLFPKAFMRQSAAGTPVFGLVVTSLLITLLLLLTLNSSLVKQFTFIILLATLASLIPYFFTAVAELVIYVKSPQQFNGKRFVGSAIVAILAAIYSFWTIAGSGEDTVFYGTLLFFSSVPVYAWLQWRRTQAQTRSAPSIV